MQHDVFVNLGKWYLLAAIAKGIAFATVGVLAGGGGPTAQRLVIAYSLLVFAFIVIDSLWYLAPRMIFHYRMLEHEKNYGELLTSTVHEHGWYWIFRQDWITETYRTAAANNEKLD